jgi:hypothetical protein
MASSQRAEASITSIPVTVSKISILPSICFGNRPYGFCTTNRCLSVWVFIHQIALSFKIVQETRVCCTPAPGRWAAGSASTKTIHNPFPIFKVQLYWIFVIYWTSRHADRLRPCIDG